MTTFDSVYRFLLQGFNLPLRDIFDDVDPGWVRYPKGLIATGATTTLDDQLFEDVLCRMMVGLFWIENEKRLMLVRESQFLDLQVVGYARESIDEDA